MESNEYFEEDDKKNIKLKTENEQESSEYNEYIEEDVKTENKEEIGRSDLLNNLCDICMKQYKSKRNLLKHIQSVHKGIKYPCNQCEYKATQQGNLKTHIESVHEKVKYPCHQCEYKATRQSNLKTHIESVHERV